MGSTFSLSESAFRSPVTGHRKESGVSPGRGLLLRDGGGCRASVKRNEPERPDSQEKGGEDEARDRALSPQTRAGHGRYKQQFQYSAESVCKSESPSQVLRRQR